MPSKSSILYQNHNATIFLIDIPTSIAVAQELSLPQTPPNVFSDTKPNFNQPVPGEHDQRKYLVSTPPLKTPYPPSSEPKTEAAKARVLARIPHSERVVAETIEPLLSVTLGEIRSSYRQGSDWCLPRCSVPGESADSEYERGTSTGVAGVRRKRMRADETPTAHNEEYRFLPGEQAIKPADGSISQPPLILSPGLNRFEYRGELCNLIVKNTSLETATVTACCSYSSNKPSRDTKQGYSRPQLQGHTFIIPPLSNFLLCNLPISTPSPASSNHPCQTNPIPNLPQTQKFNLILLDPPWSNKSVRRSRHYQTQSYSDSELLTQKICDILTVHSHTPSSFMDEEMDMNSENQSNLSIAAIWITNSTKARNAAYDSLTGAGFSICEEWIWVKTTIDGEPVTPISGLWRKPYEVLVIGKKQQQQHAVFSASDSDSGILRRVIAAVPDVHSRKPNLREVFERVFFVDDGPGSDSSLGMLGSSACGIRYSALEVFARNLTAGWWACGNEVLKFNSEEWWIDGSFILIP
ncbi:MT-A70 family [Aspergillus cavernicola]|uniref:MT-A70 family n=1 Tax=Aspergillus cavernicola TaxID=176166 RepID=A0ABR4HF03_9EURO